MITFAFGMNLDPGTMDWCRAEPLGPATLPDWELEFRGLANVVEKPGAVVNGVLWKLDEKGERSIDGREGFRGEGNPLNMYDRRTVTCDTVNGPVEAVVYTMSRRTLGLDAAWGHNRLSPPGTGYLQYLTNGYTHFGLPIDELWKSVRKSCTGAEQFRHVYTTWKEYQRYA